MAQYFMQWALTGSHWVDKNRKWNSMFNWMGEF